METVQTAVQGMCLYQGILCCINSHQSWLQNQTLSSSHLKSSIQFGVKCQNIQLCLIEEEPSQKRRESQQDENGVFVE